MAKFDQFDVSFRYAIAKSRQSPSHPQLVISSITGRTVSQATIDQVVPLAAVRTLILNGLKSVLNGAGGGKLPCPSSDHLAQIGWPISGVLASSLG